MTKKSKETGVDSATEMSREGSRKIIGSRWCYVLVVFFAALLSVGVWARPDEVMLGDDYAFHVARLQGAVHAWENGQILPQVDPEALDGFGYGYNLFYGPIWTYVAAGLRFLIGSWPIVINLILALCLVGAGLTMCYAITRISRNRILALLTAVIYMALPYLLNNMYSRMALGELTAAVAAPILLLGLYQLTARGKHAVQYLVLAAAILILSHSLSAMLFGLMAVAYVLINIDKVLNLKSIGRMILAVVAALGLTAFFVLPLTEAGMRGNYGVFDREYSEAYFGANPGSVNDHRAWPQQLIMMSYSGGEYGITLGMMGLIGILGFWFVWRTIEERSERRFVASLYILAMIAIIMALPIVDWGCLPSVMWKVQFPWRLVMIAATLLSVVSGYTIFALVRRATTEKQMILAIGIGLAAVYMATPMILPDETRHLEDFEQAKADLATVGFQAEYAPVGLLCDPKDVGDLAEGYACGLERIRENLEQRGTEVEVVSGRIEVGQMVKDGLKIEFDVEEVDESSAVVELPLIWYPGYRAALGEKELIVGQSEGYGLVTVEIPAGGVGRVKVDYGMTELTKWGLIISGVTAGVGVIWMGIAALHDRSKRRKQKEMDGLIDSVWEVMAEDEAVDAGFGKKVKEGSEDEGLPKKTVVKRGKNSTAKGAGAAKGAATRVKKAKVAEKDAGGEKVLKGAASKATGRSTRSTKTKVLKKEDVGEPTEGSGEKDAEDKPRITKVKAKAKKEVE